MDKVSAPPGLRRILKMEKEFHSKANKSQHNLVFAAWLVNTFGQRHLRSGCGVIDVAGGAGTLSYELSVRYGVTSSVWDMRNIELSSMLRRKIRKLTRGRQRLLTDSDGTASSTAAVGTDRSELMQWVREVAQLAVEDDLVMSSAVTAALEDPTLLPFGHIQRMFPTKPVSAISDSDSSAMGVAQEADWATNLSLCSEASVLVGMHPDQVTGAIVDMALLCQKPFAVVPCCVFGEQFPERLLPCGKVVSSYEDLLLYLQSKDPCIKRAQLPFLGRSTVLYHLGR